EEVSYSERYMCAELLVGEGTRDGRPRREPVAPLERRSGPALDLRTAAVARLLMTGGAMGSLRSALLGGRELGIRELVSAGRVWAFNGVAGDLDRPLLSARKGQTVRIDLVNDTRWPHAMHLHGHHFLALRDDRPERAGDWRDTELMAPGERLSIAFVADNPGKWLLHCHMLEHQAAGMRTWVEVGA
ncbi:MAG: multicopper oxidase domain-containing protein, partial [Burkholderiales bacterium]